MTTYEEVNEFINERKKMIESDIEACKENPSFPMLGPLEVAHRLLGDHGGLLYADGQWYEWVENAPGYFDCSELDADRHMLSAMSWKLRGVEGAESYFTPNGVRLVRFLVRPYLVVPDHLLPLPNGIELPMMEP